MSQWSQSWYQGFLARQLGQKLGAEERSERQRESAVLNEARLHAEILDECRRRGWISFHGSMANSTFRTLGEPDFVILADGGRVLMVECKTKTGKLSPDQLAIHAWASKLGHQVHTVRSIEEFLALT